MGKHIDEDQGGRSRTYTFSFAITRTAPDEVDDNVVSVLRSFKPVDLMLLASLATVFLIEPFAIYMLLTHYHVPMLADRCPDSGRAVVVASQYPDFDVPRGPVESDQEVVTPLNVRDPSSLIMGPAPAYAYTPAPAVSKRAEGGDEGGWKSAITRAVKAKKRSVPKDSQAP